MIRRLAVPIGAIAAAVVTLSAAPAHAADEIGLSRDGVTWSNELTAPIFEPGLLLVPGDQEVRSFRVRNDGGTAGVLTVDVIASDPDLMLADDDLTLEARIGAGPWQPVAAGRTRAATDLEVAEGAQTRVSLRATFDQDSTRQATSVPFRVRLHLAEDGDVGGVDQGNGNGNGDGDGDGAAGGLPDTGSTIAPGLLWLATGLIGAGAALMRRRGRPDRPDGPDRRGEVASHGCA